MIDDFLSFTVRRTRVYVYSGRVIRDLRIIIYNPKVRQSGLTK